MSNTIMVELNGQHATLMAIAKKATEGSHVDIPKLDEIVKAMGNSFGNLLELSLKKNARLKKKLVELGVSPAEIHALLSDDLSITNEFVAGNDFALYSDICKAEYAPCWDQMDDKTKKFLVTSYYIFSTIRRTKMDFSPVIVELSKSIEEEMSSKLYYDFILECKTKLPLQRTSNFDNELERAVFNYRKDITAYYVPLSTMFDALMPSQRLKNNIYYQMLQQKLVDGKWDTSKLCTQQFVAKGKDYAKNCRNEAAHSAALTEKKAQECMSKTKELLTEFLSAYNP